MKITWWVLQNKGDPQVTTLVSIPSGSLMTGRIWGSQLQETLHMLLVSAVLGSYFIYVYMYICTYVYMYICTYVYMYMYICIYVYLYICIYVYMYICIYVYMYICIYVYILLDTKNGPARLPRPRTVLFKSLPAVHPDDWPDQGRRDAGAMSRMEIWGFPKLGGFPKMGGY